MDFVSYNSGVITLSTQSNDNQSFSKISIFQSETDYHFESYDGQIKNKTSAFKWIS